MLQRIQTVFLILVVLLMAAALFFNVAVYENAANGATYVIGPFGLEILSAEGAIEKQTIPYVLLAVLAIASITVAVIEITKFKNRLLQIKLGTLNSVLLAGTTILAVYLSNDLAQAKNMAATYDIFVFLAPVALILNALANRFIHRDEKLVRSVDRIR
jgi:hypothetical protein